MIENTKNMPELKRGERRNLSDRRKNATQSVMIGEGKHRFTYTIGYYDNGDMGEIFISYDNAEEQNALFNSVLNFLSISLSVGFQYGVPLEVYLKQYLFARVEPCGVVKGHEHIKLTTSFIDLIFRDIATRQLGKWDLANVKPSNLDLIKPPDVDENQIKMEFPEHK